MKKSSSLSSRISAALSRAALCLLAISLLVSSVSAAQSTADAPKAQPATDSAAPQANPAPPKAAKPSRPKKSNSDADTVANEHAGIGLDDGKGGHHPIPKHNMNPDAQWFPDAGFGLFVHWSIASITGVNISWAMMVGPELSKQRIDDPAERARIIREGDYELTGHPHHPTPDEYWEQAKEFNPQHYDPDKWAKAAKDAGFQYVVLTTRHHDGFALWPSNYGDFSTKNYLGGRDLLKPYVDACRKYGLKVGFYYSPPDFHFDRDYLNFLARGEAEKLNPEIPALGPDLKPRTIVHTQADVLKHQQEYRDYIKGQITELLTRYGKIDILWFDGHPRFPNGDPSISITLDDIRKLQPGIVVNNRLDGPGDFYTYERTMPNKKPSPGWAEYCNPWTAGWSYQVDPKTGQEIPFRTPGFVLGQLARSRSFGINYLLDVGPNKDGELTQAAYDNMAVVAGWMKLNGPSVQPGAKPLPDGETASVPATARENSRYLFAIPQYKGGDLRPYPENELPAQDETLTLTGIDRPKSVSLMSSGKPLEFTYDNKTLSVPLPATLRSHLVDVVKVELPN